jgi:uncharacterized protein (UPF0248 family)
MITIKDLINKIKWDKRESPSDYVLIYIDMGERKQLPYTDIKRLEGNFMIVERYGEEVEIPLHRVREVIKKGVVVWKRP